MSYFSREFATAVLGNKYTSHVFSFLQVLQIIDPVHKLIISNGKHLPPTNRNFKKLCAILFTLIQQKKLSGYQEERVTRKAESSHLLRIQPRVSGLLPTERKKCSSISKQSSTANIIIVYL